MSKKFKTLARRIIHKNKSVYMKEKEPSLSLSMKEKDQSIIFTIARMNPPTPGHMKVVNTLIDTARAAGKNKVYVLLQASKESGMELKNPLFCREKKKFLVEMINNLNSDIEVEVICADDVLHSECKGNAGPLQQICHMYKTEGFDSSIPTILYLYVGTDRVESFTKFLGSGKYLPENTILKTEKIDRPSPPKSKEGSRKDELTVEKISGTKMRKLVEDKEEETFITLEMQAGLSRPSAKILYDLLEERMSYIQKNSSTKKTSKKGGRKQYRKKTYKKSKRNKNKRSFKNRN